MSTLCAAIVERTAQGVLNDSLTLLHGLEDEFRKLAARAKARWDLLA